MHVHVRHECYLVTCYLVTCYFVTGNKCVCKCDAGASGETCADGAVVTPKRTKAPTTSTKATTTTKATTRTTITITRTTTTVLTTTSSTSKPVFVTEASTDSTTVRTSTITSTAPTTKGGASTPEAAGGQATTTLSGESSAPARQITITQSGRGLTWTMASGTAGVVSGSGDWPDLNLIQGDVVTFNGQPGQSHWFALIAGPTHGGVNNGASIYDQGSAQSGQAFTTTHTFTDPGTYTFYCPPHGTQGMHGRITVAKAPAETAETAATQALNLAERAPTTGPGQYHSLSCISRVPPPCIFNGATLHLNRP